MSVKRVEVVVRSYRNALPLPLQSCDSWMSVKENPDRKKALSIFDFEKSTGDFHMIARYFRYQYKILVLKFYYSFTQHFILVSIFGFTAINSYPAFALPLLAHVVACASHCTLQWFIILPLPFSYSRYLS